MKRESDLCKPEKQFYHLVDDSVTEIANVVGIDNVSYFSKLFKSKFHVSPLQYRQIKNSHFLL